MLPSDLFGKSMSPPPFINTSDAESSLPSNSAALTPHKRTTSDSISNVPSAKRLQLISESDSAAAALQDLRSYNVNFGYYSGDSLLNLCRDSPSVPVSQGSDVNSAFITSRMMSFNVSDDQWPSALYQSSQQIPLNIADHASNIVGTQPTPHHNPIRPFLHTRSSDEGQDSLSSAPQSNAYKSMATRQSMPSMRAYVPSLRSESMDYTSDTDDTVFDDDAGLLSNLPTSVDDLHVMEEQLKLENRMTSLSNSRHETPSAAHSRHSMASAGSLSDVNHHEHQTDGQLDADDMEVAMINESFEEQQRQYTMYYRADNVKTAFYSGTTLPLVQPAPSHQLFEYPVPVPVPEVDDHIYNNQSVYRHWIADTAVNNASYDTFTQPTFDDLLANVIPALDDQSPLGIERTESLESFNFIITPRINHGAAPSFVLPFDDEVDDVDAIATAVASANFVLDSVDSPCKPTCSTHDDMTVLQHSPSLSHSASNDSSEDEELIQAWNEIEQNGTTSVGGERYYLPRNHVSSPQPQRSFDMIEDPPKNIKTLAHVTEVYDPSGMLDSEPILKFFRSIGMKNFYQRDIDIQRAFLVFPSVEQAKLAVDSNRSNLQLRLLEESPQFVKVKALKMHMELRPCCFEEDGEPGVITTVPMPYDLWLSQPIAG